MLTRRARNGRLVHRDARLSEKVIHTVGAVF